MQRPDTLYLYQLGYTDGQFQLTSHVSPTEPCEKNGAPAVRLTAELPHAFLNNHIDRFGRRIYTLDQLERWSTPDVMLTQGVALGATHIGIAWQLSPTPLETDVVYDALRDAFHDALLAEERRHEDAMKRVKQLRQLAKPGMTTLYLHKLYLGVDGFEETVTAIIVQRRDNAFVSNTLLHLPALPGEYRSKAKVPYSDMTRYQNEALVFEVSHNHRGKRLLGRILPSLLADLPSDVRRTHRRHVLEAAEVVKSDIRAGYSLSSRKLRKHIDKTLDAAYATYGGKRETCNALGHHWAMYEHEPGEAAGECLRCGERTHPAG